MIRTRLVVGSLLALGACGVLFGDSWLARSGFAWFPFLFAFLMLAGALGSRELVRLIPAVHRPSEGLVTCGVLLALLANWYPAIHQQFSLVPASVWALVAWILATVLIAAFLLEMRRYTGEPGVAVPRLALTLFAVAYLGLLACFFAQIRWLVPDADTSAIMLALVVFVPKGNDIGAFFTGTFLGRHKMTPVLSPKKTWEGFAGGMTTGAAVAVGFSFMGDVFRHGIPEAIAFGLVVGLAGVLGDLAESLIKRDGQMKDASKSIPGFGGVLDVIDSVLFAAPVAYLWFSWH
ncbi:Phosphatidate cytidylyltransferase [Gemmata sp. SH-PL17]|uniref:phosphatidate cytidylyltransferase n=1 Tax=Gemmata sp. SH-PL17 TaxID=1630693 RepID=UPI00078C89DC|nr:phosphatidate cytidylyltransferase [Gemmata sp. SH-PL17]AMV27685.1 Phosphatidate cytidylyltransferase [Gemmata sp. SH-PL17]